MSRVPALTPLPLRSLLERIAHEWQTRHRIFDLPSARFWRPPIDVDLGIELLGIPAGSPIGPAAGPHTQMAQNIVLAWLGGARVFELKTVQVRDDLEIARPCIDMATVGCNTEWSQELSVPQSIEEYVKAWMIIAILREWEPLHDLVGADPGPHVFDLSVGYDLAGVTSPKVAAFIDTMRDADHVIQRLRAEIPREFGSLRDLDFPGAVASTVTLSTFHGCPPSEVDAISRHLIDRHALDVIVKLNPTLLGFGRVVEILQEILGYRHLRLDRHAFPEDLQFDQATELIEGLNAHATRRGRRFGIKLTNTLVVDNDTGYLGDDPMYLSGAPLHVLATTLLDDLINAMPGRFDLVGHDGPIQVTFSAGVNTDNLGDTLGMGVVPATICSDLLEPGGYGRLKPMLQQLERELLQVGAKSLGEWRRHRWGAAREAGYRGPVEQHMAELLAGELRPAYDIDGTSRPIRALDRDLQMWGCVSCNLCVTVCPNDAFFSIRTPVELELEGRQQYMVLAELCNDCGNCLTFCPERGDPAQIKPRLYLDARRFATAEGQGFYLSAGTPDQPLTITGLPGHEADAERLSTVLTRSIESPPIQFDFDTEQRRRPRVNGMRLAQRLDDLAQIGAIEGTDGCSRLALTDADRLGRDLVVTWMNDLGLDVAIDGIGNVVATMPWHDDSAPVLTGSHIDTVATGGRYDGNLGVLAGLEVIESVLRSDVPLARPLGVAFFTDEEGARFPPDMLGSLVFSGGMPIEDALAIVGIDGAVVGEELDRIGYRGAAPSPGRPPHAFIELHVEQGPVLERTGRVIGAVSEVQGISWTEVTITGQSNHAGTTPMAMRHDPAVAAGRLAAFVHDLAVEIGAPQVGTVGKIDVHPNLVNVVPASVTMTVDLRNTDDDVLEAAEQRVADYLHALAEDLGLTITTRRLARFEPVQFDPELVDLVEQVAADNGYDSLRMPSGAGHDAQMLARVTRAGMIFVPSHRGLSHNPHEYTAPDHVEAGANVLLDVMVALANEVH